MGGEETQEGPYYNSDTLDDGRIMAPGYVNCLICIPMYEQKNKQKKKSQRNKKKYFNIFLKLTKSTYYYYVLCKNFIGTFLQIL